METKHKTAKINNFFLNRQPIILKQSNNINDSTNINGISNTRSNNIKENEKNTNYHKIIANLEEEIIFLKQQISDLKNVDQENVKLKNFISSMEQNWLTESSIYEQKILELNKNLNKQLINEKERKRSLSAYKTKETDLNSNFNCRKNNQFQIINKYMDGIKNSNEFLIGNLKKHNETSEEMFKKLIKELQIKIAELGRKNNLLNFGFCELEKKNQEIMSINNELLKQNILLETELQDTKKYTHKLY